MTQNNNNTNPGSYPIDKYPLITLAHGSGGQLTQQLIDEIFLPIFNASDQRTQHDGAIISINDEQMVMTTDSYVIKPLFFPGGNIGTLSVTGTLNDLAMCGATPKYLSCGFIIEEGLPTQTLIQIVQSMQQVAVDHQVRLITGDTKVIDATREPMVFINTTGIGTLAKTVNISPSRISPGDKLILTGDVGRHEIAVLAEREGLNFETSVESDCAVLVPLIQSLLRKDIDLHCCRDLTRGGLVTICHELSKACGLAFQLIESEIAVSQGVHAACEMLGLDPYYLANEGRCLIIVPEWFCNDTLSTLQQHPLGKHASCIGEVLPTSSNHGQVSLLSRLGTTRLLSPLLASQLPRIC